MSSVIGIVSIKRRFCAYLIDVAILLIPNLFVLTLLNNHPLILYLLYTCINCSYFTYFISSSSQATPGQKLMNIHTISLNNAKIDLILAFDRSFSQFFLPLLNNVIAILIDLFQEQKALVSIFKVLVIIIQLLSLYWYLVACFSRKKQTYHDMLFGTVVVKGTIK